jgi:endonuclease YncB( thermonuclease family)
MSVSARAQRRFRLVLLGQVVLAATAFGAPNVGAQTPATPPAVTESPTQQIPPPPVTGTSAPASLFLNRPTVVDTAHLKSGGTVVTLFGVKGLTGEAAQGLQAFITANGDRVTCHPHSAGGDVCIVPTGLDVAATALANGAAQTIADSSADYIRQEAAAQAAHLGLWAALPAAPLELEQPVVQTTAEIVGGGHVVELDGLVGFSAEYYTMQLQSYITAHGNHLSCQEQASGGGVCVLPDGTDIARVALQNGLARVSADAPASYRADQAQAVASKSGFWFDPSQEVLATLPPPSVVQPCCVLDPNDSLDGLSYDDGVPTALVDGEPAFFFYTGVAGFSFFDVHHHLRPAPEPIRAHLDKFHPEGRGLRTAGPGGVPAQATAFRAPGLYGAGNFHGPYVFNGPGGTNSFHASMALNGNFGVPAGGIRPEAMHPFGVASGTGLIGQRPAFNPGVWNRGVFNSGLYNPGLDRVRRPAFVPWAAPRPGFARVGGFHPMSPIAGPSLGFLGARSR